MARFNGINIPDEDGALNEDILPGAKYMSLREFADIMRSYTNPGVRLGLSDDTVIIWDDDYGNIIYEGPWKELPMNHWNDPIIECIKANRYTGEWVVTAKFL